MRFKVCGMKYPDNMLEVASLGPDYMGFIFYRGSKRFFDAALPPLDPAIGRIGVFVNEDLREVLRRVGDYHLDGIQLHGDESPSYLSELKEELESQNAEVEIIKVFAVDNAIEPEELRPYQGLCDYFLFDTRGEQRGGTGRKFDWEALAGYDLETPYFLSGGIGPDDIDSLKRFFGTTAAMACHAVDLNSRFEDAPGSKNREKLKKFIHEIKAIRP